MATPEYTSLLETVFFTNLNWYRSVSNSAGAVAEFETLLLGMSVENLEETKEWKDDTVIGL